MVRGSWSVIVRALRLARASRRPPTLATRMNNEAARTYGTVKHAPPASSSTSAVVSSARRFVHAIRAMVHRGLRFSVMTAVHRLLTSALRDMAAFAPAPRAGAAPVLNHAHIRAFTPFAIDETDGSPPAR